MRTNRRPSSNFQRNLEGLLAETRESGIFELPKAVGGPMVWTNSASQPRCSWMKTLVMEVPAVEVVASDIAFEHAARPRHLVGL